MAFLDNSGDIILDAVLTDQGRRRMAQGTFNITKFALGDDEIDYSLYNPTHASGSAFYGQALENMPLLEAFPVTNQNLRYKLVTLPRGTGKMPVLDIGFTQITLKQGASLAITPQTLNYLGANQVFESNGYTAVIADIRTMSTFTGTGIQTADSTNLNQTSTLGTNVSKTVVGTSINLTATTVNTLFGTQTELNTTIQIVGRDSGARITVPIKITKTNN